MRVVPLGNRGKEMMRIARSRPQATYLTPLQELDAYVKALHPFMGDLASAALMIREIVFEPTNLLRLCPSEDGWFNQLIEAQGRDESLQLLTAALSDWVGFILGTEPATLLVYADHDEYVTVFPRDNAVLARLTATLDGAVYKRVDYLREL